MGECIGGRVFRGEWIQKPGGCMSSPESMPVVIKTLGLKPSPEDIKSILLETHIMNAFRHNCLVPMLACTTTKMPVMIATPLYPNGNLRSYLIKHSPSSRERVLSPDDMHLICTRITEALLYLHRRKCVHRDIATRYHTLSLYIA